MMDEDIEVRKFQHFINTVEADDFNRTSAYFTAEPPMNFDVFVREGCEAAEEMFHQEQGNINPLLILANDEASFHFEPYHDETMRDLFQRMHREAQALQATMVFVATKLYAANRALDIDGTDGDEIREAVDAGELSEHFGWYAEHRPQVGEPDRRSGLWTITTIMDGGQALGPHVTGSPQVAPMFQSILA